MKQKNKCLNSWIKIHKNTSIFIHERNKRSKEVKYSTLKINPTKYSTTNVTEYSTINIEYYHYLKYLLHIYHIKISSRSYKIFYVIYVMITQATYLPFMNSEYSLTTMVA